MCVCVCVDSQYHLVLYVVGVYFSVVVFLLWGMENNPENGMAKWNDTNFFAFISGLSNVKPAELYGVAVSRFDIFRVLLSLFLLHNTPYRPWKIKKHRLFCSHPFFYIKNISVEEQWWNVTLHAVAQYVKVDFRFGLQFFFPWVWNAWFI
jgi:hypothetical protein